MRKLACVGVIVTSCLIPDFQTPAQTSLIATARGIHDRVIKIDTHVDIDPDNFTNECNYTMRLRTQVNLPKMVEGDMDVVFLIVYVAQGSLTPEGYANAYQQAIRKFDAIHRLTEQIASDKIRLALTPSDVVNLHRNGFRIAVIGVENGYPIGTDIRRVKEFFDRGARYMSLAHTRHSQLADSNTGEVQGYLHKDGLSELGRQTVVEMNRLGMMIDLSHPSKGANLETMRLSKAPVIASHSAVRALSNVSRNMDDEQLLALKKNGGVIQIIGLASFLDRNSTELPAAGAPDRAGPCPIEPAPNTAATTGRASVKDLVDHIDYVVKLIGIDHVGISSDFDGGGGIDGWNSAAEAFNVTLELARRGYTEDQIAKIWGGNLLRIWRDVEKTARDLQSK